MSATKVSTHDLAALGVRRISVDSALARVAWNASVTAAASSRTAHLQGFAAITPNTQLNDLFAKKR